MRPAADHMGRAEPHELATRIGHLEQGTERGLRRLKLDLDLSLGRAAEKEERQDYGRADAYEHTEPLSAIFFAIGDLFTNATFLQRFRRAHLAATTIGWDEAVATGEP